jgi:predicted DNA-binding transcriptional regulator
MKRKRSKLTIKEVAKTVVKMQEVQTDIIGCVQNIIIKLELIDNTLGAYILMEGAGDKLSEYIQAEIEKKKDNFEKEKKKDGK